MENNNWFPQSASNSREAKIFQKEIFIEKIKYCTIESIDMIIKNTPLKIIYWCIGVIDKVIPISDDDIARNWQAKQEKILKKIKEKNNA